MADKKYYVVEARLPVHIADAASPDEAARKAARLIERDYGLNISNWFFRVMEYGGDVDRVGPITHDEEPMTTYFSNPTGTKFRDINKNVEDHQDMFDKGVTPDGK